jgi:agmatinase
MKLLHSNVNTVDQADVIVIGVPDESRSHAKRRGASKGPDSLRIASNSFEFFERAGKIIPICPMKGTLENKKILDFGNIPREDLYKLIFDIIFCKENCPLP